jgi:hypothetical protein
MSALLAALVGGALLTQPSAEAAMQTLLKAAVTLRTFDYCCRLHARPCFDAAASRGSGGGTPSQRVAQVRARVDEAERNPRQ